MVFVSGYFYLITHLKIKFFINLFFDCIGYEEQLVFICAIWMLLFNF